MTRFRVTFVPLGNRDERKTVTVNAADETEARSAAVSLAYGGRTFWHRDSGLGADYGQVFRPVRGAGHSTSVTDRMRTDIDAL